MSGAEHVALIGCGFTGTSAFFQLVDRHPVREITVFEATGEFGPGYPYRPDECRDYLINNTTDTMCLAPSNRRAFVEWLRGRPDLAPDLDEKGHLPRAVYGAFLKDVVAATRTVAAIKNIRVRLVPHEATRLAETEDGRVRVGWRDEGGAQEIEADAAILTTGRSPDLDRIAHPPAGAAARYVPNHILSDAFDDLPLDATVHVLGASLSAYDVVNRLFSPESGCRFRRDAEGALVFEPGPNARHVVLCSRSGRMKNVQAPRPMAFERRRFTLESLRAAAASGGGSLEEIAELVRQEAAAHGAEIDWAAVLDPYAGCETAEAVDARAAELMQAALAAAAAGSTRNFLVDFFGDAQRDVWDGFAAHALTPEAERRYREDYESALLTYAAPCPIPTAERLLALHRAGRLRVAKGARMPALRPDGAAYEIAHDFGVETASVLVNTTGSVDRDVESAGQPPLIRSLVAQGLLTPYVRDGARMKGAAVDMARFRAEGARSIYLANMLLWGPGFFTSSAFMMARVVEQLLDGLYGEA